MGNLVPDDWQVGVPAHLIASVRSSVLRGVGQDRRLEIYDLARSQELKELEYSLNVSMSVGVVY